DPVNAAPTTSTRVFYISVGVCCAVIFLVAIILAVLHLHSMKRIELDDRYIFKLFECLLGDTFARICGSSWLKVSSLWFYIGKNIPLLNGYSIPFVSPVGFHHITLHSFCILSLGTFGRIFHGILIEEKDPSKEKQVFVKTVKGKCLSRREVFICWCPLLSLSSRNLLPITHVCIEEGEKPMVLLPYMNWGNLKLFLRQCKLVEANNPQAISQQDLVHMAIQIACGMSYLARREVIHKDLAARNCVIDDALQVKITDNALSRDLFPMDYHCLGDNENRPVRWMALESLVNNEFSSASDVWAFGVTLWELMTLGQTPYVDIDPFEMAAYLKDGYRIAQPINCPDELFAVMACCWALDPEERPKFQQLVQCLTEFHAALGAYV
ncbi:RYK kinase, partial [Rostratula benghalensis]|nr:RYK kinase [Rostratula benghalensis]